MTKSEQIAQLLDVPSTDVFISNSPFSEEEDVSFSGWYVKVANRELTDSEKQEIEQVFESPEIKKIRAELNQRTIPALEKSSILERKIEKFVATDDKQVLVDPEPVIPFEPGLVADWGMVFSYEEDEYKVMLPHTTQADWTPDVANTLFSKKPTIPDGQEYPDWVPWDGHNDNLYQVDTPENHQRVYHNGDLWRSTVANNHWEPGVFGWEIVNEEE